MSTLNSLKLIAAAKPLALSPVLHRRNKLIVKLDEQREMAQAQQEGRNYAPTKVKRVQNSETGEVRDVTMPKRVKSWSWTAENGKTCVAVRYGSKVLELVKGKTAVEVGSNKELVAVLTTLRKAVEAGELDAQIEAVGAAMRRGFKR